MPLFRSGVEVSVQGQMTNINAQALEQYSCLENPMDGGAWQATVRGIAKSQT